MSMTTILEQRFFKDNNDQIFVIDIMLMNENTWREEIKDEWIEITKEESDLISNPPPNQQEINQLKEAKNIAFLLSETRRTSDAIEVLNDAIEFELATDEEIAQHKELRKYRLMLSRVQNQQEWPLNPVWPECPEFFKPKE